MGALVAALDALVAALDALRYRDALMRRPQSASGLTAVLVSLLVVPVVTAPASARSAVKNDRFPAVATRTAEARELARTAKEARQAGTADESCTGWRSDRTPPETIRVLRAKKRTGVPADIVGSVEEVPFREYVGVVLAAEWPSHYPLETLKAGALAVKQYAWYFTIVYRGGEVEVEDGGTECYDIVDTTTDQVYYPEEWSPSAAHRKAIDATWDMSVRKYSFKTQSSRLFLTGYRSGSSSTCGADANGWKLFQRSARRCGLDGLRVREILRTYLSPRLEIVITGRHDILGTDRGDASALLRNDQGQLVAHVWTPGSAPPTPGSRTAQAISMGGLVGAASSDVDGDGRDDLVWLRQTDERAGRLRVSLSDGVDYGEPRIWYWGTTKGRLSGARLLTGDFNADGRRDAAILVAADTPGKAALYVFRKKPGEFSAPAKWWSGSLDLSRVRSAWAGDVTGDGRADLIIREDLEGGGLRIKVARATQPSPGLDPLKTRFEDRSLEAGRTLVVPGDVNRDGRDDLFLVTRPSGPGRIDRLQGSNSGNLRRVRMWRAPKSDPIPVGRTQLGAADVDHDGRTDLVLFSRDGSGTRIRVLRARYTRFIAGPDLREPALDQTRLTPY